MNKFALCLTLCLSLCLHAVAERTFYTLNHNNGLSDDVVLQMLQLHDGRLIVYSGKCVNVYDGIQFGKVQIAQDGWRRLSNYSGYTHLYVGDGHLLWIKERNKMTCVDLKTQRQTDLSTDASLDGVSDFFIDSQSCAWYLKGGSLISQKGDTVTVPKGLGQVQDLDVNAGRVYVFFSSGKLAECGKHGGKALVSSPYGEQESALYDNTSLLSWGKNGLLYQIRTGSGGGILLEYDTSERKWRTLLKSEHLLHTLTVTPSNTIYLTTSSGYLQISPETGVITRFESLKLPDGSSLDTGINTVCLDREGGIWLGTYGNGLLYTSPYSGLFDTRPVDIKVTPILSSVYVDGELKTDVVAAYMKEISLPYSHNSVAFRFSTMNYVRPRSTCYKYRLRRVDSAKTGQEAGWTLATADSAGGIVDDRGSLYISLVDMRPGDYSLEVKASTNINDWHDSNTTSLSIHIDRPWYASGKAAAVYVIIALAAIAGGFLVRIRIGVRNRRQRLREEKLLLRVKLLAEELSRRDEKSYAAVESEATNAGDGDTATDEAMSAQELDFLNKVTTLVEKNIADPAYTVELLSHDMCMERTGLYKKLTALMDKSPVSFIRSIRLKRAAELLSHSDKSISEVSEATGFSSPGYFSKCFQAEYGCKPSEYRDR